MNFLTISAIAGAILLGWGVSNLGISVWRQFHPSYVKRQFWLMNGLWGAVNSLIAASIIWRSFWQPELLAFDQSYQTQQATLVFINIFLDCAYMLVGYVLSRKQNKRLRAFGWSVIIQGGFLCVFDLVLWILLSQAI